MNPKNDIELLNQFHEGDKNAFKLLYDKYWERLYLFCFRLSANDDIASSIVQDFFVQLWEKRASLEIKNVESYFFRSVKNQLFKYYRDKKFHTRPMEDRFEKFVIQHPIETIDSELLKKLQRAINQLPAKRKEILLMNKVQDMNAREIAEELEISEQTVKNQLSSSLKQLRLEFKNVSWLILLACLFNN